MRSHGDVVVGPTVQRAVIRAVYTEVNARLQTIALSLGGPITYISAEEGALRDQAGGDESRARSLVRTRGGDMKLVIAIIKPFKLDEVRDALTAIGVAGLTVTEVKGYGRQKGHTEIYRGAEYVVNFLPKIRVALAVNEDQADRVVTAIQTSAKTGQIGDGKIFVMPLDHALRIRTGETDSDAL